MGKVLYTAYNQEGYQENGFIDVSTNKEALNTLKEKGFEGISLHGDASLGVDKELPSWFDNQAIQKEARLEVAWQKEFTFSSYMWEVLKEHALPFIVVAGMAYFEVSQVWMMLGLFIASIGPLFALWNYRRIATYNNAIKSVTFGEMQKIQPLAQKLRKIANNEDLRIEADSIEAFYHAYHDDINSAMKLILPHRALLDEKSPGMFENKMASLYYAAGEYDKFVSNMKQATKISNQDLLRADWAMAEARMGDIEIAREEIAKIDKESMADFTLPLILFTEALIAYRSGDLVTAQKELHTASHDMSKYDSNPAVWSFIALITATLALVKYDLDKEEEGRELLSDAVIKIVKVHGDRPLIKALEKRFGI